MHKEYHNDNDSLNQ